jgi:hypothetical protein
MSPQQTLTQRWDAFRPTKTVLAWSCAACAIAAVAAGFTWGGWVTGGTARTMAEAAAVGARNELVAAVCVDRFKAGSDVTAQLTALKELQGWNRATFVQKAGWATMPDRAEPNDKAARLCADQLAALDMPTAAASGQ